ncbi:MAG: acetylornithine/succinylornithine family transaminase [Clostridiales Family XIII bacterium]|jgi:acetylornithine/N-succinyldiaminopimelate aminotransferase|nr:acetylornithine/succinylornithine family transaminase [Clostridiales Family XIII bacterium]
MQLKDYGLTAEQVIELTKKYMIDTYERFSFVSVRAKGMYLYDENDNAYLDFYGGIAVNSAGNCNEKVVAAVIDQVQDLMHTFNYPYTIPQALLAEKICTTIGMDKVYYQNSGTESNEAMIKLARKYGTDNYGPNRYHIVTAKKSFHGRTYGALSATGQPESAIHKGFEPVLPGFSYAEFNNLDSFKAAVTDDTIAIMVEPVQGEGGVIPATKEFLEGLRKLCDEKGMLLLFDEVQTGWFRTGTAMCYQSYGVKPDVVSMAKALGGGMPIGAIAATAKAAATLNPGSHGSTYSGNPICCAAALAQVNEMIDRKLGENATEVGNYFMDKLKTLPHVKDVRGMGLLVGVEFDIPNAVDIKHNAIDRNLLTTAIGANIIRMVPPLIVTKEDCDKAYAILKESVEAIG